MGGLYNLSVRVLDTGPTKKRTTTDGPSDTDNKPNQTTLSDRPRDRTFSFSLGPRTWHYSYAAICRGHRRRNRGRLNQSSPSTLLLRCTICVHLNELRGKVVEMVCVSSTQQQKQCHQESPRVQENQPPTDRRRRRRRRGRQATDGTSSWHIYIYRYVHPTRVSWLAGCPIFSPSNFNTIGIMIPFIRVRSQVLPYPIFQ